MAKRIKPIVLFFILSLSNLGSYSQNITLNEIMFDPPGLDYYDEYIEVFNYGSDTVSLKGFKLSVNGYIDSLISPGEFYLLYPYHYCLILDRGYVIDSLSNRYKDIIPDTTLILTINDNAFGKSGLTNSDENYIYLIDNQGDTMSYMVTSPDQESGYSDEKINPYADNRPENWGNSIVSNDTSCFQDSIVIKHRDLILDSLIVASGKFLEKGDSVYVQYKIINAGIDTIYEYYVNIVVKDAVFHNEIYRQQKFYYQKLVYGESLIGRAAFKVTESGKLLVEAILVCQNDESEENNFSSTNIFIGYPPKCLIINEVMYCPQKDKPEWIEIFNCSDYYVNLENFRIKDASGKVCPISDSTLVVNPGDYLVLTSYREKLLQSYGKDAGKVWEMESFPVLNNTGDSIVIIDCSGFIIDSLYYTKDFGYESGVSIERRNPYGFTNNMSNWGLSISPAGATPGMRNSIMRKEIDLGIDSLYVLNSDGAIDVGDSFKICLKVKNYGLKEVNEFEISIDMYSLIFGKYFDQVKTYSGIIKPDSSICIDFIGGLILSGINRVAAELSVNGDENEGNNSSEIFVYPRYLRQSIVINEIMYDPNEDEPEWIEIYNRSQEIIDIAKWRIRDGGGNWRVITDTTFILKPNEYMILAGEGNFIGNYPNFSGKIICVKDFPILNNTSDSVFICDGTGNVIDGVYYKNQYGGGYGISLERRDPNADGQVGENWGSCLDLNGATPGRANSILKFEYDISISDAHFIDTIASFGEEVNFVVKLKNVGRKETGFSNIEIRYDSNFNGSFYDDDIVWQLKNIPGLQPDSSIELSGKVFITGKGYCHFQVIVSMVNDKNLEDNYAYMNVYSKVNSREIVINEFFPYPEEDQCEYIELYNLSDFPINLNKMVLSSKLRRSVIENHYKLNPGECIVLSQDSSIFDAFIPEEGRIIIPSSWIILNNYAGDIKISGMDGEVIDYLSYNKNWGILPGKSIEKKFPALPSQDRDSWSVCTDPTGGTPGYQNSITPYQFDVCIDSLKILANNSNGHAFYSVNLWIRNIGLETCKGIVASIFKTGMNDFLPIEEKSIESLKNEDTCRVEFLIDELEPGKNQFIASISCDEDLNSRNDTVSFVINIPFNRNSLILTEFLIKNDDLSSFFNPEFIEIHNMTENVININGWAISDENKGERFFIYEDKFIYPDSFFVISFDSTIFNFEWLNSSQVLVMNDYPIYNRDEDEIILYDPVGNVIDSLRYDKNWNMIPGKSMERISFNNANTHYNWKPSKSEYGCTPGLKNSISMTVKMKEFGIKIYPNPITPDGDGTNDEAGIYYNIPFESAIADVYIYDLFGRMISNVAKNQLVESTGVIFWDGSSMYSKKVRVGIYVVRFNAKDVKTGRKVGYISTVVVAGKL